MQKVLNGTANFIKIFYYAGKRECDFVVIKENKISQVIQVCYELSEENRNREVQGLLDYLTEFKLNNGYLLTYDQQDEIKVDEKLVQILPVWRWLLER